ncbi:phosphate butyryltransferase [Peptoclostridium litorale DSM 5388]|uniref:Phosphate butyryltransferase Ptb n=1 Tax=Peptoclostridium litorale DSM 5388 TaxID=1121324 RepID=A0A069RHJ3_PEPLI|nr:bifunctional enoyl-CoA hydratase/phosphate acetyltransferase [Peptoclostridium litorale]KDR96486.1 phosphate butyryltransferase Ptb [Peptoclostridium litorale DSM 5388]SIN70028.1 phosphate butyryltransferase [Peptoclostridium litorale DSM 5388]
MFKNFEDILSVAKQRGPFKVSVAAAHDREVIEAVKMASDIGLITPVLVGKEDEIRDYMKELGMNDVQVVDAADEVEAARKATLLVKNGEAKILMKGFVNTSVFMKAVLNKEEGLRSGRLLSHMAAYEIPGQKKITFCSDSGINVAPTLEQKKDILTNALLAIKSMGIEKPKVAALAANEMVNPKILATADARALVEMHERGEIPSCIIEGPIAMDVACSSEAAKHKGIDSQIAGDVDLFFSPFIEVGNVLGKAWLHYCNATWAGIVLGATNPIMMGSRSDTAEIKLNSIAMACLSCGE